ncbi:MAG TPA: glycosyltransferase [Vicinamibacterales bacterium]|nr:glycosyltransferase [Vicinamibacterales bacterium]
MVSIIIPAHNEEALIRQTVRAADRAARECGVPFEIVVVDDASTDRTAAIASAQGARIIAADVRQIAGARNAGARGARGDRLVFVDADTVVPAVTLGAALAQLAAGAVGGGASPRFDAGTPAWARRTIGVTVWFMRTMGWAAGCFLFARRDAFERVGGFDERYFASEEIHLSRALKRIGRFVILREHVVTSGRKAHAYSPSHALWLAVRMLRPGALKRREQLEFWYSKKGTDR